MAEPLNTGLSAQQVLTAFDRALNDYTDDEINTMLGAKQDTVADIETIRTGAANGTSALQQVGIIGTQGAKNALRLDSYKNQTSGSTVTFTWNEDSGTISAVTSSATPKVTTYQLNVTVTRSGTYRFTCGVGSAVVADDPESLYDCFLYSGTTVIRDNDPTTAEPGSTAYLEAGVYRLDIRIHNGVEVDTVFRPMLRLADITDDTFAQYAPTNRELYEMIAALTARVEALENA